MRRRWSPVRLKRASADGRSVPSRSASPADRTTGPDPGPAGSARRSVGRSRPVRTSTRHRRESRGPWPEGRRRPGGAGPAEQVAPSFPFGAGWRNSLRPRSGSHSPRSGSHSPRRPFSLALIPLPGIVLVSVPAMGPDPSRKNRRVGPAWCDRRPEIGRTAPPCEVSARIASSPSSRTDEARIVPITRVWAPIAPRGGRLSGAGRQSRPSRRIPPPEPPGGTPSAGED